MVLDPSTYRWHQVNSMGFFKEHVKLEGESSWGIGKESEGKDMKADVIETHYTHV